jgi:hypothetical protein
MRTDNFIHRTQAFAAAALAIALLAVLVTPSMGQIKSGTIVGTVTDPTGAVVPDATITVVNQETNVTTSTVSDKSGTFTVPYLQPGIYGVTVQGTSGFAKYNLTNIAVATGQTVKVNAKLSVGSNVETVKVTADAVELQTTNATVEEITNQITMLSTTPRSRPAWFRADSSATRRAPRHGASALTAGGRHRLSASAAERPSRMTSSLMA